MRILYVGKKSVFTDQLQSHQDNQVEIYRDEIDAMRSLKDNSTFDVICAEFKLPIRNGFEFLKKVKSNKNLKYISCILLQEKYDPFILQEAFKIGIDDYYSLNNYSSDQVTERIMSLGNDKLQARKGFSKTKRLSYKIPSSKRLFDILMASIFLLILSPVLLITMIAIRIESKGKVYYRVKRVGRGTFYLYKFRSVKLGTDKSFKELTKNKNQYLKAKPTKKKEEVSFCHNCAELSKEQYSCNLLHDEEKVICEKLFLQNKKEEEKESSRFIKIANEPQITKVGKFIRKARINNLLQLINVIKGDMSLVGNKPLHIYEAETLTNDQLSKRFLVPAGITGLWQVKLKRKEGSNYEAERTKLDNKYADYFINNNYLFWLDISILLRSIPVLLRKSTA